MPASGVTPVAVAACSAIQMIALEVSLRQSGVPVAQYKIVFRCRCAAACHFRRDRASWPLRCRVFITTRATLTKHASCMLAPMFRGDMQAGLCDAQGHPFLDRCVGRERRRGSWLGGRATQC